MTGFVKAMRTEEADFLDMYPIANHMLNVIARRARRTPCKMNQLEVGECYIGHKGLGLTERQYRTAKKQLSDWSLVEFKKGRKATDRGTVAKLVNTKVYDINETLSDGRKTEEGRKEDGRETTNKECKKEKNDKKMDFSLALNSWNELGNEKLSKHRAIPDKAKRDLPKVFKKYHSICKTEGKEPREFEQWVAGYFGAVSDYRNIWSDNITKKTSMEYACRVDTYDKVLEWLDND